jgi:hypothetical protein
MRVKYMAALQEKERVSEELRITKEQLQDATALHARETSKLRRFCEYMDHTNSYLLGQKEREGLETRSVALTEKSLDPLLGTIGSSPTSEAEARLLLLTRPSTAPTAGEFLQPVRGLPFAYETTSPINDIGSLGHSSTRVDADALAVLTSMRPTTAPPGLSHSRYASKTQIHMVFRCGKVLSTTALIDFKDPELTLDKFFHIVRESVATEESKGEDRPGKGSELAKTPSRPTVDLNSIANPSFELTYVRRNETRTIQTTEDLKAFSRVPRGTTLSVNCIEVCSEPITVDLGDAAEKLRDNGSEVSSSHPKRNAREEAAKFLGRKLPTPEPSINAALCGAADESIAKAVAVAKSTGKFTRSTLSAPPAAAERRGSVLSTQNLFLSHTVTPVPTDAEMKRMFDEISRDGQFAPKVSVEEILRQRFDDMGLVHRVQKIVDSAASGLTLRDRRRQDLRGLSFDEFCVVMMKLIRD